MKKLVIILSILFTLFSFTPTIIEIASRHLVPKERAFLLEHNYLFDYNFYLSRIRQGYEGRYLVTEKYYNQPHTPSLFQVVYLYIGRIGAFLQLSVPATYHLCRLVFGFTLLCVIGFFCLNVLAGRWGIVAFLLVLTAGSWPIPMMIEGYPRFGTYMGWWSVFDSLQRITHLPHVLFGQLLLLLFIRVYMGPLKLGFNRILWGLAGFVAGIIFPPTLIIFYTWFGLLSIFEFFGILTHKKKKEGIGVWIRHTIVPRILFTILSSPSLFYTQYMFTKLPWSALPLMDILHRIPLPYKEYALALGPMLPLGLFGTLMVFVKRERKLFPVVSWVLSVGLLIVIFERVPQQSPLRFTEAAVHIPLGVLSAYLFQSFWHESEKLRKRTGSLVARGIKGVISTIILLVLLLGLSVMVSMIGWLTDQVVARRVGTWVVPIGAQVVYPLKDFMDAIYFVRDNVPGDSVVLTYITAGNYIPAYAGQFVFIGHINTPDEIEKEKIAKQFFEGKMTPTVANAFLQREHVSYVFFGPQEKELGNKKTLTDNYPYLSAIYENPRVIIYKVE